MAQKAKRFLRSKVSGRPAHPFTISADEGGYVGSLVGLGFVERIKERGQYFIIEKGRDWLGLENGR